MESSLCNGSFSISLALGLNFRSGFKSRLPGISEAEKCGEHPGIIICTPGTTLPSLSKRFRESIGHKGWQQVGGREWLAIWVETFPEVKHWGTTEPLFSKMSSFRSLQTDDKAILHYTSPLRPICQGARVPSHGDPSRSGRHRHPGRRRHAAESNSCGWHPSRLRSKIDGMGYDGIIMMDAEFGWVRYTTDSGPHFQRSCPSIGRSFDEAQRNHEKNLQISWHVTLSKHGTNMY